MSDSSDDHTEQPPFVDLALLANFVHQVVNPLNGVAGTLDNLQNNTIEEHRRLQRLRAARAQVEQCITLMRNLAFLSTGFKRLDPSENRITVLPQAIIESAMFFQEDGALKNIRISLKDRNTQNRVVGHPELIRQVLMNIFDNCIKYGAPGTEVVVNQWLQKGTNNAMISINSQSRYPIDVSEVPYFAKLGFRGSNAKKAVASGTGLGLAICSRIIEDVHGGTFTMQARLPNNLEFLIKIPGGSL
ncbi:MULTISPECIES: HAMP domain-containing sensor histidine kinase [unclassified Bradyrhizobium]|uniref:sensor histidine kinase n=1 Tax=unclassified Bradyrhizobium TaxID=2631580 RepID=UPI0028EA391E|nr:MULTISPECIES: HAMP domain-containing sensor histidine kinase [unclassified Bradyrhizobium]